MYRTWQEFDSSTWANEVEAFFQDTDNAKVSCVFRRHPLKRQALRVSCDVRNRQFKVGGDSISRYRDIRPRAEADFIGRKSRRLSGRMTIN